MRSSQLRGALLIMLSWATCVMGYIIHVPRDYATIQAGIETAIDGDTVLVAPGDYYESLRLREKTIVLGSWFIISGDKGYISRTILHGGDSTIIRVNRGVGPATTISGFTLKDGRDGINPRARINILYNHIISCVDGIDYERGSGGICSNNVIEDNEGEGLDLNGEVDIVIEDNVIRNNKEDGIEITLLDYAGPLVNHVIRRNFIYGNRQDGIQLVDYPGLSQRVIRIERNVIFDNGFSGIGLMGNGKDKENYEGADVEEPIYLIHNTIFGNNYGMTGGDRVFAINNLFGANQTTAMRKVDGHSIVAHSNLWLNGTDFDSCNVDQATLTFDIPLLDENYFPTMGGSCFDGGATFFAWQGNTVLNATPDSYSGAAPDIGAFESVALFEPLPAEITCIPSPGQVELVWRSADADNSLGFEILRSQDGIRMSRVAFVESQPSMTPSGEPGEHRYVDSGLLHSVYYYRLMQNKNGRASLSSVCRTEVTAPEAYGLPPNYPNPFNGETTIKFDLPTAGQVTLKIYNSLAQEVRTLVDEERPAGYHRLTWDGRDGSGSLVASGVYFYQLRAVNYKATRALTLIH